MKRRGEEVNIYVSIHYYKDNILLYKKFEEKTGIKVNIIHGKGSALIQRLEAEGANSPADVFLTDTGNLFKLQGEGLLQSIQSETIKQKVPVELRGQNDEWVAFAKNARVIIYNPKLVNENEIKDINYEDLANPMWKGKVVIRSSSNVYNQFLVSSLISNLGIDKTKKWAKGFVSNFARKPKGNDKDQIMAVANGEAHIAIANTNYMGIMLSGKGGKEQLNAAKKVKIAFPNQTNRGTHVNISGGGVLHLFTFQTPIIYY